MSGLTGILTTNGNPPSQEIIRKMTAALAHRGPDGEDVYSSKALAFGFRRLSLIDILASPQLVHNEDKTVWAMMDGKLYGCGPMRAALERTGHTFTTRSDAEILVHLYENHGEEFLEHLDGMFAVALWDDTREVLLLARDRMGKKPLYYSLTSEGLIFASELKALLCHPACRRALDPLSLVKYLHFEYIPAPATIYSGIGKLRPAERLVMKQGNMTLTSYWDIPRQLYSPGISFDEARGELRRLLHESVARRLGADLPPGIFLSGGVGSGAIAALAVQTSSRRLSTFTVFPAGSAGDISAAARTIACHLKTDHHELPFSPDALVDLLPSAADSLDEPLAGPAVLPAFLLSRYARKLTTVALAGEGCDEFFAGYPTYYGHRLQETYENLPAAFRAAIRLAARRLPESFGDYRFDFARRFMQEIDCELAERHARWMCAFLPEEMRTLLAPDIVSSLNWIDMYADLAAYAQVPMPDRLQKAMYFDAKMILPDGVLARADRAGMAASLEIRSPFLDREVVEFAAVCPSEWKLKDHTPEYILRKIVADMLPQENMHRNKGEFAAALSRWLRQELAPITDTYLNPCRIGREGIFQPAFVSRLIDEHRSGKHDHRAALWALLFFQVWKERHG